MKLFLDDNRTPYDVFKLTINPVYEKNDWEIVKTHAEFVSYIETNGLPDIISFDHDLSFEHYLEENQSGTIDYNLLNEKTGYHCAAWLIEYCTKNKLKLPQCLVHSMNPIGSENIKNILKVING
jgi:hypothetical protein